MFVDVQLQATEKRSWADTFSRKPRCPLQFCPHCILQQQGPCESDVTADQMTSQARFYFNTTGGTQMDTSHSPHPSRLCSLGPFQTSNFSCANIIKDIVLAKNWT